MKSSHTSFIDAFTALICGKIQSDSGVYAQCRDSLLSDRSVSSCYAYAKPLIKEWKDQLPTHHYQILMLKSVQVPDVYCEFLLKEFDAWFAKEFESSLLKYRSVSSSLAFA